MIINPQVPLHRLILSLSDALDFVHPLVADHQQRVAYIAIKTARQMGWPDEDLTRLFLGAALHDIGLIQAEHKIRVHAMRELEGVDWHSEAGYELLRETPLFEEAAKLVRYHHAVWEQADSSPQEIPLGSHIIAAADELERRIDRSLPVLVQRDGLLCALEELRGGQLHPDCVEAMSTAAQSEAFWLDLVSHRIYSLLLAQVDWPMLQMSDQALTQIARVFSRVVDATSPWTATHSAGVTAVAVALSSRMGFSPREQLFMRTAGYLHDLGKLSIPSAILDKPGRLTREERSIIEGHTYHTFHILDTIGGLQEVNEWASFHHERLDGQGYPFRHRGHDLTLGARIMAVADTFTAITEDRPYRAGMDRQAALNILHDQVSNGGFDGQVVYVLETNYEEINSIRAEEQAAYAEGQRRLSATFANAQGIDLFGAIQSAKSTKYSIPLGQCCQVG